MKKPNVPTRPCRPGFAIIALVLLTLLMGCGGAPGTTPAGRGDASVAAQASGGQTGSWGDPAGVGDTNRWANGFVPSVGVDDNGSALVVWEQMTTDLYPIGVYAARYDAPGDNWIGGAPIASTMAGPGSYPELAMHGPSGVAYAIYRNSVSGVIAAKRYSPALGWDPGSEAPGRQITADSYDSTSPCPPFALAVGPGPDDALAIWGSDLGSGGLNGVYSSRYDAASQSWSAPTTVWNTGLDGNIHPRLAVNSRGDALAVWRRQQGEYCVVNAAFLPRGASSWIAFDNVSRMSYGKVCNLFPMVAASARGTDFTIAWLDSTTVRGCRYSFDPVANAWAWNWHADVRTPPYGSSCSDVRLASVDDTDAIVIWQERDSSGATFICYNRFTEHVPGPQRGWQSAAPVPGAVGASPRVASGGFGKAMVVWSDRSELDGGTGQTRARRYNNVNGKWDDALFSISSSSLDPARPTFYANAAMNPVGRVVGAWQQYVATPNYGNVLRVFANRFIP